jgi:RNA polymerase sigma-70 factor (ECF subfamily)
MASMEPETQESLRLSHINTDWAWIRQAHMPSSPEMVRFAQERLLHRYGNAVRRYLLGALRNQDAADELFQEFSLRFVRGDFHNVTPERGRFRQFLKTVLYHLIVDYQRRQRKTPIQLTMDVEDADRDAAAISESDRKFTITWRAELLNRTWWALEQSQPRVGIPYYDLLRYRTDHPAVPSGEMAKEFSRRLGKPVTADAVRQTLKRARDRFADLLVAEVHDSLDNSSTACLTDELEELGLLSYCGAALERKINEDKSTS